MKNNKKEEYEAILNRYYYKENKDLSYLEGYISRLKYNRKINFNRWFELHNFILNLGDY